MERLVLACPSQDPLQFTYQPHVGVDDSIIYLLQKAYSSLDGPNTSVRIVFFDFSSAFNTIQPRLLRAKLGNTRGTVLSPFLFTTYTADFKYCTESCHLQKFCDDTAIVGCVEGGREAKYRDLVDHFVKWCGENHLQLNVDVRRNKPLPSPVCIGGTDVVMVPACHTEQKTGLVHQHRGHLQEGPVWALLPEEAQVL
ncbi:hypothetical protein N1851_016638 [Merluccius polli]|uniref:Reverse transcriptase domain-containing protein n=1 Tax=Merluccius polli TaxID=89951 RepID=A0AA47MRD6_MERPO|nr:hypothetical protein N1851_016638 [Merluccius polli]